MVSPIGPKPSPSPDNSDKRDSFAGGCFVDVLAGLLCARARTTRRILLLRGLKGDEACLLTEWVICILRGAMPTIANGVSDAVRCSQQVFKRSVVETVLTLSDAEVDVDGDIDTQLEPSCDLAARRVAHTSATFCHIHEPAILILLQIRCSGELEGASRGPWHPFSHRRHPPHFSPPPGCKWLWCVKTCSSATAEIE